MSQKKKITKSQSERDKEMEKILSKRGEKDITEKDFLDVVKKVSKKKTPKGSGK